MIGERVLSQHCADALTNLQKLRTSFIVVVSKKIGSSHKELRSVLLFRIELSRCGYSGNASNSAFVSFRSSVSNPSVNQPKTGTSSSRACRGLCC